MQCILRTNIAQLPFESVWYQQLSGRGIEVVTIIVGELLVEGKDGTASILSGAHVRYQAIHQIHP